MTLVRAGLNIVGGALVAAGAVKGDDMTALSAAVLPLASIIWGWTVHTPEATVSRADILKAQGLVNG